MSALAPSRPVPIEWSPRTSHAENRPAAVEDEDSAIPLRRRTAGVLDDVLRTTRHHMTVVRAGTAAEPEELRREAALLKDLLRRWVRVSVIWDERLLASPTVREYAQWQARAGAQVRVGTDVPVAFAVVDFGRCVIEPAYRSSAGGPVPAPDPVVSSCPETVNALHYLFLGLWESSKTLHLENRGPDGQTQSVLSMLAEGLTDQQIAHRLKVCERTVGRTVARIMEKLNARSRFEAGVRAALLGWIGSPSERSA